MNLTGRNQYNREGKIVVEQRPNGLFVGFLVKPANRQQVIFVVGGAGDEAVARTAAQQYAEQAHKAYHTRRIEFVVGEELAMQRVETEYARCRRFP